MPGKNKNRAANRKPFGAKKRAQKKPRKTAAKKADRVAAPAAVLDSQKLKELYSSMLKLRMQGEKAREAATAFGREAILAGATAHTSHEDTVIAGENQLAQALSRANEVKGQKKTVLIFYRDDAPALLFQQDGLPLAARNKLPLVCLSETSFSALTEVQGASAGQQDVNSYFPQIVVDGTDVVAVFRVTQEAVRRARGGHGPSLIQCVMPQEIAGRSDPLVFMERYLRRRKLW